jgi:pSer/pThr/pTyr-binding forkhead associated (FHA) protein
MHEPEEAGETKPFQKTSPLEPLPEKAPEKEAPKKKPSKKKPTVREAVPDTEMEADPDAKPWGLILQTPLPDAQVIGVDVRKMVVIGRGDPAQEDQPDLDLTPHRAYAHGVSRRHAILMPTKQGLMLIDLDSTNGTWLNGINLKPGQRYRIRTGDTIEFGTLQLDVRLVGAVRTGRGKESTMITRPKPKRGE